MTRIRNPEKLAAEVVDDAVRRCGPRSGGINAAQREALLAAAPFAGRRVPDLVAMVDGHGNCAGEDPEDYFQPYPVEPANGRARAEERELARRQCGGCPVAGQCLALDYAYADGHVQTIWGIAGGLATRDRRQLLPLWIKLGQRVNGADVANLNHVGGSATPAQSLESVSA